MKKLALIIFCCYSTFAIAQEESIPQDTDKKNEITLNALTLIASGWIDVSYEYLINKEASRVYFSNKYARGFFIEGFGMLHRYKDLFYDYDYEGYINNNTEKNITEFSLGVSVGGKWVTKSGFVAEIFGGIGRNILNNSEDSYDPIKVAGRVGVSIGKRF